MPDTPAPPLTRRIVDRMVERFRTASLIGLISLAGYIATIFAANWAIERYGIDRAAQDAFAVQSQEKTGAAYAQDRYQAELAPLDELAQDEHPRPDTTLERLASLLGPGGLPLDPENRSPGIVADAARVVKGVGGVNLRTDG